MKEIIIRVYNKLEAILIQVALKLLTKLGITITEKIQSGIQRIFRFIIMGIGNMMLSYITYLIIILMGGNYFSGSLVAFVVGVINAYYWNNGKIFNSVKAEDSTTPRTMIRTVICYVFTGLILQVWILHIWIDLLSVSEVIAPFLNVVIIVPINYILNRYWVYR